MAGSPFLISSYSVALWVGEVFSSTLLPGFSGLASSVLHADLPPSAPYPLRLCWLIRLGFLLPYRQHFLEQSRRVSLGKALQPPHIPSACISVRFVGYWISPIHDCSILSPIPFRRFAVRYVRGSTSCFLSTRHFCSRSCLVGVVLPSGNGGQFYFRCNASEYRL